MWISATLFAYILIGCTPLTDATHARTWRLVELAPARHVRVQERGTLRFGGALWGSFLLSSFLVTAHSCTPPCIRACVCDRPSWPQTCMHRCTSRVGCARTRVCYLCNLWCAWLRDLLSWMSLPRSADHTVVCAYACTAVVIATASFLYLSLTICIWIYIHILSYWRVYAFLGFSSSPLSFLRPVGCRRFLLSSSCCERLLSPLLHARALRLSSAFFSISGHSPSLPLSFFTVYDVSVVGRAEQRSFLLFFFVAVCCERRCGLLRPQRLVALPLRFSRLAHVSLISGRFGISPSLPFLS